MSEHTNSQNDSLPRSGEAEDRVQDDGTREEVAGAMEGAEAAEVAIDAVDELAELASELDRHRDRVQELEDQLLRRAAEFQNYRRRTEQELGQAAGRGRSEVLLQMLDVLDDLRRSLDAAAQAAEQEQGGPVYQALKEGVELVYKKFQDTLAGFGVQEIEAVGQPFNEDEHEAMMQQEAEGVASGTVVGEIQRGYRMGDRVLRHARVIVAR